MIKCQLDGLKNIKKFLTNLENNAKEGVLEQKSEMLRQCKSEFDDVLYNLLKMTIKCLTVLVKKKLLVVNYI